MRFNFLVSLLLYESLLSFSLIRPILNNRNSLYERSIEISGKRIFKRFAEDGDNQMTTTKPKVSENIDLFAADDREAPPEPIKPKKDVIAKDTKPKNATEKIIKYDAAVNEWLKQMNVTLGENVNASVYITGNPFGNGTMQPVDLEELMKNGSIPDMMFPNSVPGKAILRFPASLPMNMMPMLLRSKEIGEQDLEILKKTVFDDLLNDTVVEESVFLVTFRGTPAVSTADTFKTVARRISLVPGMRDRLRVFVLPDYNVGGGGEQERMELFMRGRKYEEPYTELESYSGEKFSPIFVVCSKDVKPKDGLLAKVLVTIGSLVTAFLYATDVNSMNSDFVTRALAGDDSVLGQVFPIVGGVLLLQFIHDLGHYLVALANGTKLSFPSYPIPSLQIGVFGSVTRFLDFPKTRDHLFDVSIAGPVLGFIASLACTINGLMLTSSAAPELLATFPKLPTGFFSSSFLIYQVVDQFLHISSIPDPNALTAIHPLVAIGVTGLFTNALNFLPIGRLDGGRVAMSIAGRKSASRITTIALISQLVNILTNFNPVVTFWMVTVILLQRGADIPPEDDVTPVSASGEDGQSNGLVWFARLAALLFCVALTSGVMLPVPADPSTVQVAGDASANFLNGLNSGSI